MAASRLQRYGSRTQWNLCGTLLWAEVSSIAIPGLQRYLNADVQGLELRTFLPARGANATSTLVKL
eukprot:764690-Hanusia_phi.AAC.7